MEAKVYEEMKKSISGLRAGEVTLAELKTKKKELARERRTFPVGGYPAEAEYDGLRFAIEDWESGAAK